MKTIQFKTQDGVIQTINVKQITHFRTTDSQKGTFVYLSCGNFFHTQHSLNTILDMIKKKGLED